MRTRNTLATMLVPMLIASATLAFAADVEPVDSTAYRWADAASESGTGTFFTGSTTHLSHFEMTAVTLAPGESAAEQALADLEELVLVKSGELRVVTRGDDKTIGPGSIVLTMPGDYHRLANAGDAPVSYFVMRYRSKAGMKHARGRDNGGSIIVDFDDLEFQPHDRGGLRDYFDRPTTMCDNFEMHVTTLRPGIQSHPPHTHVAEEIILMIGGNAAEHIDGTEHPMAAGDMSFLGSMVPHAIRNTGDTRCMYFAFQWR